MDANPELWLTAPVACCENSARRFYNYVGVHDFAHYKDVPVFSWPILKAGSAADAFNKLPGCKAIEETILSHPDIFFQCHQMFAFDAPVILKSRICVQAGIVNGTKGRLVSFEMYPETPVSTHRTGDSRTMFCLAKQPRSVVVEVPEPKFVDEGKLALLHAQGVIHRLGEGKMFIVLLAESANFQFSPPTCDDLLAPDTSFNAATVRILSGGDLKREKKEAKDDLKWKMFGFPYDLFFAVTAHKSQAQTIPAMKIEMLPHRGAPPKFECVYVAATRTPGVATCRALNDSIRTSLVERLQSLDMHDDVRRFYLTKEECEFLAQSRAKEEGRTAVVLDTEQNARKRPRKTGVASAVSVVPNHGQPREPAQTTLPDPAQSMPPTISLPHRPELNDLSADVAPLRNFWGTSCWANSSLQALWASPVFRHWVDVSARQETDCRDACLSSLMSRAMPVHRDDQSSSAHLALIAYMNAVTLASHRHDATAIQQRAAPEGVAALLSAFSTFAAPFRSVSGLDISRTCLLCEEVLQETSQQRHAPAAHFLPGARQTMSVALSRGCSVVTEGQAKPDNPCPACRQVFDQAYRSEQFPMVAPAVLAVDCMSFSHSGSSESTTLSLVPAPEEEIEYRCWPHGLADHPLIVRYRLRSFICQGGSAGRGRTAHATGITGHNWAWVRIDGDNNSSRWVLCDDISIHDCGWRPPFGKRMNAHGHYSKVSVVSTVYERVGALSDDEARILQVCVADGLFDANELAVRSLIEVLEREGQASTEIEEWLTLYRHTL